MQYSSKTVKSLASPGANEGSTNSQIDMSVGIMTDGVIRERVLSGIKVCWYGNFEFSSCHWVRSGGETTPEGMNSYQVPNNPCGLPMDGYSKGGRA